MGMNIGDFPHQLPLATARVFVSLLWVPLRFRRSSYKPACHVNVAWESFYRHAFRSEITRKKLMMCASSAAIVLWRNGYIQVCTPHECRTVIPAQLLISIPLTWNGSTYINCVCVLV